VDLNIVTAQDYQERCVSLREKGVDLNTATLSIGDYKMASPFVRREWI